MRILYLNYNHGMHPKNQNALDHYKNIELVTIYSPEQINHYDLSQFNAIYSPCIPIDVSLYPITKFLFGPHFSIFPDEKVLSIKGKNTIYLQPSEWAVNAWKINSICNDLTILPLPFGVDTEKFKELKPIRERNKVFLYTKHRSHDDIHKIEQILQNKNIEYKRFNYGERYNEYEYLEYLQDSKYGIILDAHESQGFALQEALSCNVPLFVWSVQSMNQVVTANFDNFEDIPATTIPYWDKRCGEFFYQWEEMESIFDLFLSKLEIYEPRQYIIENLSMEVCEQKMLFILNP